VFENAVACALQRELHLKEDTTGHKTALHFLRDKEKREVDFLAVVGKKPRQLVEVKLSDDTFSKSLSYYRRFVPGVEALQVVRTLRHAQSDAARTLRMVPAAEYLANLSLT
jgi:hypothetical protein